MHAFMNSEVIISKLSNDSISINANIQDKWIYLLFHYKINENIIKNFKIV
jgi:hypothetical protein